MNVEHELESAAGFHCRLVFICLSHPGLYSFEALTFPTGSPGLVAGGGRVPLKIRVALLFLQCIFMQSLIGKPSVKGGGTALWLPEGLCPHRSSCRGTAFPGILQARRAVCQRYSDMQIPHNLLPHLSGADSSQSRAQACCCVVCGIFLICFEWGISLHCSCQAVHTGASCGGQWVFPGPSRGRIGPLGARVVW